MLTQEFWLTFKVTYGSVFFLKLSYNFTCYFFKDDFSSKKCTLRWKYPDYSVSCVYMRCYVEGAKELTLLVGSLGHLANTFN